MKKQLDLNIPGDARRFIKEALPEAMPDKANVTHFDLQDGTRVSVDSLTDSQAVQYAWEVLPIYQAAFPDLVDVHNEH